MVVVDFEIQSTMPISYTSGSERGPQSGEVSTVKPNPMHRRDAIPVDHVREMDRAYVFHSWSAQALINPLPIAGAAGCHFWDYEGKRYLDFSCQLVNINIGYQDPKLIAAIQAQAGTLCTIQPLFANDVRGEAARLIADLAPGDLNQVFFTNGGAEANEHALRLARLHTGRSKVLAAYRSYHGATVGAIALTGEARRWASEPGLPGIIHYWGPYLYRSSF
jgi:taurine--2-oxoglutarate transaminase